MTLTRKTLCGLAETVGMVEQTLKCAEDESQLQRAYFMAHDLKRVLRDIASSLPEAEGAVEGQERSANSWIDGETFSDLLLNYRKAGTPEHSSLRACLEAIKNYIRCHVEQFDPRRGFESQITEAQEALLKEVQYLCETAVPLTERAVSRLRELGKVAFPRGVEAQVKGQRLQEAMPGDTTKPGAAVDLAGLLIPDEVVEAARAVACEHEATKKDIAHYGVRNAIFTNRDWESVLTLLEYLYQAAVSRPIWDGNAVERRNLQSTTCPRCGIGSDTDGDRNCVVCGHLSDEKAAELRQESFVVGRGRAGKYRAGEEIKVDWEGVGREAQANRYVANPVEVTAYQITKVEKNDRSAWVWLSDGSEHVATAEMCARMMPRVGDYWVVQEDGYVYLNPKDVFERKYRPVNNIESKTRTEAAK